MILSTKEWETTLTKIDVNESGEWHKEGLRSEEGDGPWTLKK